MASFVAVKHKFCVKLVSTLSVLVVVVVADHLATSGKQPNKHKDAGNTNHDVDGVDQPSCAHCDPSYEVKVENAHKQPVERAHDC